MREGKKPKKNIYISGFECFSFFFYFLQSIVSKGEPLKRELPMGRKKPKEKMKKRRERKEKR